MPNHVIVGISGKKQSGKNTLAVMIAEALKPIESIEIAFADAVKEEVAVSMMVSKAAIEAKKDFYRSALQLHGMSRREKNPDYWVEQVFKKILKTSVPVILITDCRFQNEAFYLKEVGAILVRVNRDTGLEDNHISETELDNYPFEFIVNNDSLVTLKEQAEQLANKIKYQFRN
jgi:hypothetical protein